MPKWCVALSCFIPVSPPPNRHNCACEPAQEFTKSLGAAAGLNYKTGESFASFVKAQTADRGVDLILDCVGGSYWEQNVDACVPAPHPASVASRRHC